MGTVCRWSHKSTRIVAIPVTRTVRIVETS
ncbi:hypothetical protein SAMN05216486_10528 [bacterium JGI 053]|nr:hypothetical protein SAMN05216486_10528 [bacterium JGI 053]